MPDLTAGNANLTLNQGAAGRTIYTEDIGGGYDDKGNRIDDLQMSLNKVATGPRGINDGPVTDDNPFTILNSRNFEALDDIRELLASLY